MVRTLCIYNYYEKNAQYKENLIYFLTNGVNDNSDYLFVVNGESSVQFPEKKNIKVLRRENKGFDFMAWSYGIDRINIDDYDYFIFLNTSVRGPFVNEPDKKDKWQDLFTSMIRGDVKLVGTTICVLHRGGGFSVLEKEWKDFRDPPYIHVQSQMFAMDRECLIYLKPLIFNGEYSNSFFETVLYKEIKMSQYVLNKNWNINCVATHYRDKDYRVIKQDFNHTSRHGDSNWKGAYFGGTLTPYDVIFIKTNRDIYPIVEKYTENTQNQDTCMILPISILLAIFGILLSVALLKI